MGACDIKKKVFTLAFALVALACVWSLAYLFSSNVSFDDPQFDLAIRSELNLKEDDDITFQDLQGITQLDLSNRQIENLNGIQHFQSLESLSASRNKIEDISYLKDLRRLTDVNLEDNNISNIVVFTNLSQITNLNIRENYVVSLDSLKNHPNIRSLNAQENEIESLEPLRDLHQLENLNLRYNNITSIEPIVHLPNLVERLYVQGNNLEDEEPLVPLFDRELEIDIPRPEYTIHFSHEAGLYSETLELQLDAIATAGDIRYTVDNTEVTSDATVYTEPIPVNETMNVRAKFFPEQNHDTTEFVQSYLIDESSTLPIIAITTDEANLFDERKGIYTKGIYHRDDVPMPAFTGNYMQRGREWERPIHLQLFETDGSLALSQHAGMRIHGNQSRTFDQKSFRLYARSDYGENRFRHTIFGYDERQRFNRLLLRNSGQDYNKTFFRDAFMQGLVQNLDFDTQLYRPARLFINGDDWGIYNIRERYDHHYFRLKHNIQEENLDVIEHTLDDDVIATIGDTIAYEHLEQFIREHDMGESQNFEKVAQQINLNSLLDYYISQIYFDNNDWPHNNYTFYREKPHGKWQFALFDTDAGFDMRGLRVLMKIPLNA
ncbi:CotH kinase family protein [Geomicrobium sp. JCM 19038]|uniref:CotH kinase family protein n=1 Tax=Geomicrobium sp. JCM 19038 TaxID=1460635 RepID=UPI00187BD1AC|nr:CotH kinase family protein [Geomicrobium sp. JCM 19038]